MANAQSVAPEPSSSSEAPPPPFLHFLKNDVENPAFNDIQLESSDGELVPCSRVVLSMCSTVFADLFEIESEDAFPTPFPAWLLREIRHVCYFGTFSFQNLRSIDDDTVRKLCQLLVAMDYYQLDNALSESLYNSIYHKMVAIPSLACVVVDEFGLSSGRKDARPWIEKSVRKAGHALNDTPCKVLLPQTNSVGGVCSIQDANKIQQILARLGQTWNKATVWVEFEVLYAWANADPSNRASAAELWEETGMFTRLKADDPEYFADRDDNLFNADNFGSNEDFVELRQYASEKNSRSARHARDTPTAQNTVTAEETHTATGDALERMFYCALGLLMLVAGTTLLFTLAEDVVGRALGTLYIAVTSCLCLSAGACPARVTVQAGGPDGR